jgi:glyoxylase-like metal-dependent hydrolase (beta-lactamase superfamily II)
MMRVLLAVIFVVAGAAASAAQPPAAPADDREITPLGGDLYRVRSGRQHTVFLVSPDGIVLVDPLSAATARWLSEQFAKQFPGVPVRHVILTHHHADRASGAGVFAKTARVIAQEEYRSANARSRQRAVGTAPNSTFVDSQTIANRVELIHAGPYHSPEMTVVAFKTERMLFAAEPPPITEAPFDFGPLDAGDVVRWLETVSRIDVDRIMFSDGTTITPQQLKPLAEYLSRMYGAVLVGYERGQSLEDLQRTLRLEAYRTVPHYAGRERQIAAMYRQMFLFRTDLALSGVAHYFPENDPEFCSGYDVCTAGGVVPAGTAALQMSFGRRIGLHAEVSLSEQFWSTRVRASYDEELALRATRVGVMFRLNLTNSRNLALLAGVSRNIGDVRGMDRVQGRFIPVGGRHVIIDNDSVTGAVAGIELSQRIGALRIVLPLRATYTSGELPTYWPSRISATAGVGFVIPLIRKLD